MLYCKYCDYTGKRKDNFNRHNKSKKHDINVINYNLNKEEEEETEEVASGKEEVETEETTEEVASGKETAEVASGKEEVETKEETTEEVASGKEEVETKEETTEEVASGKEVEVETKEETSGIEEDGLLWGDDDTEPDTEILNNVNIFKNMLSSFTGMVGFPNSNISKNLNTNLGITEAEDKKKEEQREQKQKEELLFSTLKKKEQKIKIDNMKQIKESTSIKTHMSREELIYKTLRLMDKNIKTKNINQENYEKITNMNTRDLISYYSTLKYYEDTRPIDDNILNTILTGITYITGRASFWEAQKTQYFDEKLSEKIEEDEELRKYLGKYLNPNKADNSNFTNMVKGAFYYTSSYIDTLKNWNSPKKVKVNKAYNQTRQKRQTRQKETTEEREESQGQQESQGQEQGQEANGQVKERILLNGSISQGLTIARTSRKKEKKR